MKEYIMIKETGNAPITVMELVRCKDCVHRGNAKKCIVAFVAKEQDFPVFLFDNRGYWFCADGKRTTE